MKHDPSDTTVLVTGASGFIATHCIAQLLDRGYRVRGTLRTPSREAAIRTAVETQTDPGDRLSFCIADLTSDDGWADAVQGCTYVLHVASPFPRELPEHEDDLIRPAREGALRVLRAAAEAGVERVVMTSSLAAVVYGHGKSDRVFDESDWSVAENCGPYPKSKTLAERAAWDFIESLPGDKKMELAVINPGVVLGPVLEKDYGTSGEVVRKLMKREMPGCADVGWAPVDVRDVAGAHIAAMVTPAAAGKRFCCALDHVSLQDIAKVLETNFASRGYRIPTRVLPNFLVRIAAIFDKTIRVIVPELGKKERISSERIRKELDWQPRSFEEMVVAMGDSMIEHGIV